MERMNCPNCGAPIGRFTRTCEYCGSEFEKSKMPTNELIIEAPIPNVVELVAMVKIPPEVFIGRSPAEERKLVLGELAKQLMKELTNHIEIKERDDVFSLDKIYSARLKVVSKERR